MASNGTITVNDGESTPVAHSFVPVSILDGSIAAYQNKSVSSVIGRETLRLKMGTSAVVRTVNVDLKIPNLVTEVINGVNVPRVVDFATGKATIIVPLTWEAQECENVRTILANTLLHATIGLAVDEAEFVW